MICGSGHSTCRCDRR